MSIAVFDVTVFTSPSGTPVPGSNNTFQYFTGTFLALFCYVTPTPPPNSEFSWSCSTGCFADMEMNQIIYTDELEETDSGVLNCSVSINEIDYFSELIEIEVIEGRF